MYKDSAFFCKEARRSVLLWKTKKIHAKILRQWPQSWPLKFEQCEQQSLKHRVCKCILIYLFNSGVAAGHEIDPLFLIRHSAFNDKQRVDSPWTDSPSFWVPCKTLQQNKKMLYSINECCFQRLDSSLLYWPAKDNCLLLSMHHFLLGVLFCGYPIPCSRSVLQFCVGNPLKVLVIQLFKPHRDFRHKSSVM